MESAFAWIQKIFDVVFAFFPTRVVVKRGYRLLKFKWSGEVVVKEPGLRWYWPLVTDTDIIAVARQAVNDLFSVKFLSKNNIPCAADASCVFVIEDPIEYYTKNFDTDNMLKEVVSASLCSLLINKSLNELKDIKTINEELLEQVKKDTKDFGIKIKYVRLNNVTKIIPIANIQG